MEIDDSTHVGISRVADGDAPGVVLTRHVVEARGGYPEAAVLAALGVFLRQELRRRELRKTPPSYVGVDATRWDEAAWAELTEDCYEDAVLRRFTSLRAHALLGEDIGGYVRLNVRSFLTERQKAADPVGYFSYQALRRGLERLVDEGALVPSPPGARLHNGTLLVPRNAADRPVSDADLEDVAVELGEAFASPGRDTAPRLEATLRRWTEGAGAFRVRELATPMKDAARRAVAALAAANDAELGWERGTSGEARLVPTLGPDLGVEARQSFAKNAESCREAISALRVHQKMRDRLHRVFDALVAHAEDDEEMPTQKTLSEHLAITRSTLSTDFQLLAEALAPILTAESESELG